MVAPLTICKMTTPDVQAIGEAPAVPGTNYYFLTTNGLYAGDIAENTGVTAQNPPTTDFSGLPLTPVKSLIRTGIIVRKRVVVKDSAGKRHIKTLIVTDAKTESFDDVIVTLTWPVGAQAGATIVDTVTPTRVVSRR